MPIGNSCDDIDIGLTQDMLNNHESFLSFFTEDNHVLSNEIVMDLYLSKNSYAFLYNLLLPLFANEKTYNTFKRCTEDVFQRRSVLIKSSGKKPNKENLELKDLLMEPFPPTLKTYEKSSNFNCDNNLHETNVNDNLHFEMIINDLLQRKFELESKIGILSQSLKEVSKVKVKAHCQVKDLTCEKDTLSSSLKEAMIRLGEFSTRNVNKRIKRQKDKVNKLEETVKVLHSGLSEQNETTKTSQELNKIIDAKLINALKRNNQCRKKAHIWKAKAENFEKILKEKIQSQEGFSSHISNLD